MQKHQAGPHGSRRGFNPADGPERVGPLRLHRPPRRRQYGGDALPGRLDLVRSAEHQAFRRCGRNLHRDAYPFVDYRFRRLIRLLED